ncbi:MAG: DUF1080 domain-containing protein [Planctomycetota bacterium]
MQIGCYHARLYFFEKVTQMSFQKQSYCVLFVMPLFVVFCLFFHASIAKAQTDQAENAAESTVAATDDSGDSDGWIQLFNGRDLTGWTPKIRGHEAGDNWRDTFRVVDGVIQVNYDQYDEFDSRFGHLFYNTPYSNYVLRVEYRFTGDQIAGGPGWAFRNSGLMVHGQDPATMTVEQDFPVSIEVQLLGGNGTDERTNLNVCTPGTNIVMHNELVRRHCNPSNSATYHGDQWVSVEIEVRGNEVIRHRVDGETVLEYHAPQLDDSHQDAQKLIVDGNLMLSGGTISLQSESHPCEFRKVELRNLDR